MKTKRSTRPRKVRNSLLVPVAAFLALSATLAVPLNANAEPSSLDIASNGSTTPVIQKTAAYPVNQILREADDKCGRHALLRQGYYNGVQGFGFDKMFHKHNLKHTGVFVFVLGNPNCGTPQGGSTIKYDAYANRVQCGISGCEVVDIRRIYMPVDYRNDPGIPGQKGVITAFCFQNGEARCPDWVDQSINLRSDSTESVVTQEKTVFSYTPLKSGQRYTATELNQS
jgi:hypothetical protein